MVLQFVDFLTIKLQQPHFPAIIVQATPAIYVECHFGLYELSAVNLSSS